MIIGKTKCNICQNEKELSKEELIDLIDDCDTQERIISFVTGLTMEKRQIIIPVMCPECEKDFEEMNRQK